MRSLDPVRIEGLTAGYGERIALGSVTLELPALRTSALLGPGGSGKSTLLRLLCGGYGEEAPGLWTLGRLSRPPVEARRQPQKRSHEGRTLSELLGPSSLAEVWSAAPAAADLLSAVDGVPLRDLPFGPARLAELTAVVAGGAPLLLLDEPEADLDERQQEWVTALIRGLRGRRTVVLATHNLRFARSVADLAFLLVRGEVVESGPVPRFFDSPVHPRTRDYVRLGG